MIVNDIQPYFRDRLDAGRKLAAKLQHYQGDDTVVMAIPRGGIPVGVEVAKALDSPFDIVVVRKIPIPSDPEAGFGAVTEDGTVVLNNPMVATLGFSSQAIEIQAEKVRREIKRRSSLYRSVLKPSEVKNKRAVIIDDGLASGYTTLAAVKSMRQRGASSVVVAAPVASAGAWELIKPAADAVICLIIAYTRYFAVAGFYRHWYDLTDEEVIDSLAAYTQDDGRDFHEKRGVPVGKA